MAGEKNPQCAAGRLGNGGTHGASIDQSGLEVLLSSSTPFDSVTIAGVVML
jgi:hypothetical protein